MKPKKKLLVTLLCVVPAVLLVTVLVPILIATGCEQEAAPVETTAPTVVTTAATEPPIDPVLAYTDAVAALESATDLQLTVTSERSISQGTSTYTGKSEKTVQLYGLDTQAKTATVSETITYGQLSLSVTETYIGGVLYMKLDEFTGRSTMSYEDFAARLTPAVILDETLYGSVTGEKKNGVITVSFTSPTAAEAWAMDSTSQLVSAEGTATIENDRLTSATYTLVYNNRDSKITDTVTVSYADAQRKTVVYPVNASAYTTVNDPDGLKLIEQAYAYLLQTDAFASSRTEKVVTEVGAYVRTQEVSMDASGTGDAFQTYVNHKITQTDDYSGDVPTAYTLEERFENGSYVSVENGGAETTDTSVTAQGMESYCKEFLIENILELDYLSNVTVTDLGDVYVIDCIGTEELAKNYCSDICYSIWQDSNVLTNLASDYETTVMESYVAVDKYTGLPSTVGIKYSGIHTITGKPYTLSKQLDQTMLLDPVRAGEDPSQSADAEKEITPLLYKVTGDNGQYMWLFGTVAVGDERATRLPQEVNVAFSSATYLAVECDTQAYDELRAENEDIQKLFDELYYYSDGTTTADHIENKEIYDRALRLLKASGSYDHNSLSLRPFLWRDAIAAYYQRKGSDLLTSNSVDTYLLTLAKESGKAILEVDTIYSQTAEHANWSDKIQELLLGDMVNTSYTDYCADINRLYELWCEGDEAAIIAYLDPTAVPAPEEEQPEQADSTVTTDATAPAETVPAETVPAETVPAETTPPTEPTVPEEPDPNLPYYEEYNKIMYTERRIRMLDTALYCLKSDDVVFYAVGLDHLLAADGLVNTLRQAGYTVEPVSYK